MNSDYIKDIITKIENSIKSGVFENVENTKLELKDLSSGNEWSSLKESICAFLNSDGGVVICGVRERNGKYNFTGFNRNNENNLIELQNRTFKNDEDVVIDLTDFISLDYTPFLTSEVALIRIMPLSEDLKYVKYNNKYFERKLTSDMEIPLAKINRQKEYKAEIEHAKELSIVNTATINDFSLEKINTFINLLNRDFKIEALKSDLEKAVEFLIKKHFYINNQVTTLGLLVCGEDPTRFLEYRSEVDCYFDTKTEISKDKAILQSDVIDLMEKTFRFIWNHINVGRTYREGGLALPEYPEELIREVINNALAHRDYTINNFITVKVEPENYISVKNPGSFKEKIKILDANNEIPVRRLIPGIPESKNPKLSSVLKVFDKIESQGRGMASLVNACLQNMIDLPYYEIKENTIELIIPTGKLVDDQTDYWIEGFNQYLVNKLKTPLTDDYKCVLAYFYKSEILNRRRYFTIILSESNNHFNVIENLKKVGLISEHTVSREDAPVFILDRVLLKTEYTDEFIELIGPDYINFDLEVKHTLNILYRFTKYNKTSLRAVDIAPEVYRLIYGKENNLKAYESLGRKTRAICKTFLERNVLISPAKNRYQINFNYNKNQIPTLFPSGSFE